ncbi:MAG: TetR/AcrR family transcriptional regulator [Burkholderiales bacterium]|nr:TetR/AcrR family transcriptional regulator [Burkholderiales bacterium]
MPQASTRLSPADTKTRILDAAEALFVNGGFESMSMRQITTAAGVNLAAVNYHFGSKDALIQAVLARQLDPLNAQRVAMLEWFEANLGDDLTCEHVLVAMFLPAVRIFRGDGPTAERYLHFLGRAYTDPSSLVRDFINNHYVETLGRFFVAFQRTLPDLSRGELGFRLHFAMGALSGILAGGNTQRLIRDFTRGEGDDESLILTRLASLMVAALKAPLPDAEHNTLFGHILKIPGFPGQPPSSMPATQPDRVASSPSS